MSQAKHFKQMCQVPYTLFCIDIVDVTVDFNEVFLYTVYVYYKRAETFCLRWLKSVIFYCFVPWVCVWLEAEVCYWNIHSSKDILWHHQCSIATTVLRMNSCFEKKHNVNQYKLHYCKFLVILDALLDNVQSERSFCEFHCTFSNVLVLLLYNNRFWMS